MKGIIKISFLFETPDRLLTWADVVIHFYMLKCKICLDFHSHVSIQLFSIMNDVCNFAEVYFLLFIVCLCLVLLSRFEGVSKYIFSHRDHEHEPS